MSSPIRIAMWSGPRNISTAMMRAFENRADAVVSDEPFYAAYLADTGLAHPMRDEILAAQATDWRDVVAHVTGAAPRGRPVWYQKHMTHHMRPAFGRDWIASMTNAFLIRPPDAVIASYVEKRTEVTLDDLGFPQQVDLFDREADRLGEAPPVVEAGDVLADPRGVLGRLCARCSIPFDEAMLAWPTGRRESDGVWAPAWYDKVEQSTGFAPPRPEPASHDLPEGLRRIADAARPLYEHLQAHTI